jgi:uroporphyrinogen decarboxylase
MLGSLSLMVKMTYILNQGVVMSWTSRERVVAAINHREPDRVPVDFTPLLDFYLNLKGHLGLDIEETIKTNMAMEVIPHPDVLKAMGVDIISVKLAGGKGKKPPTHANGLVEDAWGVIYKPVHQSGGGMYYETAYCPLAELTEEMVNNYPWPATDEPGRLEATAASAKYLYENTDFALVGRFGGPIIEMATYLMGFEKWMVTAASEPELAGLVLDKITDVQIALDRVGLEACGKYLQIFKASGEDYGGQQGPLYSMKMFRNLLLPRLKRRVEAARKYLDDNNPECKIMLHSCGSIRRFLPDLIEAGIDIIDPVQPLAAEMDSFELKRDFGDKLTFHGGVDIQEVLPFGTEAEVIAETRKRIHGFAPGGGYILAASHNVQADTPPVNLMTMIKAAHEFGVYPIQ